MHPEDFPDRLVTICETAECARELLSNAAHFKMLREKSGTLETVLWRIVIFLVDMIELIYTTDLNKASIIGFRGVHPRILMCSFR